MTKLSNLAPINPSGPGTSASNPFKCLSIPHGYNLLKRLRFRSANGGCKVAYERVGTLQVPGLPHPVDQYTLFVENFKEDEPKDKLMDFYIYAYSDVPHSEKELPAGLVIINLLSREAVKRMDENVQKNPELKKIFDDEMLRTVNIARMQRGLAPLDRLPEKGSCMLVLICTVLSAACIGAGISILV